MKTKRVQVDLPEKSYKRLVSLKEKTEAASYTEVVKNALKLYENMIANDPHTQLHLYRKD